MISWGHMALCVSILTGVLPDEAFDLLEHGNLSYRKIGQEDIQDMIALKGSLTYKEIGQMFGLSADAVRRRMLRYQPGLRADQCRPRKEQDRLE